MSNFFERVQAGKPVILDGGTGTEMEKRGAKMEEKGWSASCTLTAPDLLRGIHEDYIKAGAEVIITNTFSTSKHVLADCGLEHQFEELNAAAVKLAHQARDNVAENEVWVAGSISSNTFYDEQTAGKQVLKDNFDRQAEILAENGVDFLMLEMVNNLDDLEIVYPAAAKTGLPVIVGFNTHTSPEGEVILGRLLWDEGQARLDKAIQALPDDVPMITIMHTMTNNILPALEVMHANFDGPTGVYAHWGKFVMPNWQFNDMISAEAYADEAEKWVAAGTRMVGGCCGIGPDHIRELTNRIQ